MEVIYKGQLWEMTASFRESFFEDIKQSDPNKIVKIERHGNEKLVKLSELKLYSIERFN